MAETAGGSKLFNYVKGVVMAGVGIVGGVFATYTTAVVNQVTGPGKPLANFAVTTSGLTVTCQNHATGESGWWDFGDGSPLDPFVPEKPATHTYAKAGNYSVKLTVRNFLAEETDRSVPVSLESTASDSKTPLPTITNWKAESVSPQVVAPATIRIKGEIQNAEKVIWDLGNDKLEVTTDTGPFERLVVFDKPGRYPIQLIGHSGKTAVKQATTVMVMPPAAGSLSVIVKVTDTGSRIQREEFAEIVPVPVPTAAAPRFEKVVPARPEYTIAAVKVGTVTGRATQNIQAIVAPDKKSVRLTGEWVATGDAGKKAAGGPDVMISLVLNEERQTVGRPVTHSVSGALPMGSGTQMVELTLPEQPRWMQAVHRQISLEIQEASTDGTGKVMMAEADMKMPWSKPMGRGNVSATLVGNKVQVSLTRGFPHGGGAGIQPPPSGAIIQTGGVAPQSQPSTPTPPPSNTGPRFGPRVSGGVTAPRLGQQ